MSKLDIFNMTDEEFKAFDINSINADDVATDTENTSIDTSENIEDTKLNIVDKLDINEDISSGSTDEIKEDESPTSPLSTDEINAFYKEVTKPINVDGHDISFDNPKDIRDFISKNASLVKKSQYVNKHKRFIDSLEKNELLNDTKLNTLIAISKGNSQALKNFIKENNIDITELMDDFNDDPSNKAEAEVNYIESEAVANLTNVLDELKSSENGTILISKATGWDDESKQHLVNQPRILTDILEHMDSGIYDEIESIITKGKILGKISPSTSFLAAYNEVFNQYQNKEINDKKVVKTGVVGKTKSSKPNTLALKAGLVAKNTATTKEIDMHLSDILSMSDEDFKKKSALILKEANERIKQK